MTMLGTAVQRAIENAWYIIWQCASNYMLTVACYQCIMCTHVARCACVHTNGTNIFYAFLLSSGLLASLMSEMFSFV